MAPRTINKSAFVREMGDMPVKEIIRKAQQRGFSITPAHVYTIRAAAKRKGGTVGLVARRPGRPPNASRSRGGGLQAKVNGIAQRFVDEILAALKDASLDDIVG